VKASFAPILAGLLASSVLAGVSAHVYRADEITPLAWADPNIPDVYQDIMVGTRLTIFIGSDTAVSSWNGGLRMSWEDWDRGIFSGRNHNEDTGSYDGSILVAAGDNALVSHYYGSSGARVEMIVTSGTVGEWVVLDYHAMAIGTCDVRLYSVEPMKGMPGDWPPSETFWIQELAFSHVAPRDYDDDDIVNFEDFALLANQWHGAAPADPNETLAPDLNADNVVDITDLALFCEYWLERTDIEESVSEPNGPGPEDTPAAEDQSANSKMQSQGNHRHHAAIPPF